MTTGDSGIGFEPAGQRDVALALWLSAGRRDDALSVDRLVFVVLSTGHRDVALSADRLVFVVLSTGHRDVAFADGGITLSPRAPTSTLSPCFVFDFGWTGFASAASASARARAAFAAELSASNRGGSVGLLT